MFSVRALLILLISRGMHPNERKIEADAKNLRDSRFNVDPGKTYSLAELVNLAEAHNPETRLAWLPSYAGRMRSLCPIDLRSISGLPVNLQQSR